MVLGLIAPISGSAHDGVATSGWSACPDAEPLAECAHLEVPLDHDAADSPTMRLAVRRIGALDPDLRIGALVTIAGGPGQRGTDLVRPGLHSDAIAERFDSVGWDPRGTSGETHIDCIPEWDPYAELDRTPDTDAERAALDARTTWLATRCRAAHGELLPYVGTLATALDLERLRVMLDVPTISLLGLSYGSRVALTYATLFPERVRAIVVDGYRDPNLDPAEQAIEQAAAFETRLDALLASCAADADCAFGGAEGPERAFDRLLARLDTEPVAAGTGRVLTQSDAYEAVTGSLILDAAAGERLLDALARADAGAGGPLLGIATDVRRTYQASGLTQGTFMAITCADSVGFWRALSPAAIDALAERIDEVAPRLGAWLWSPPAAPGLPPLGLCAMQPTDPSTAPRPIDAAGAGPVLVLATSGDPTTPLIAARRAVEDLEEAGLVVLDAEHHLAYPYAVADPDRPSHRCLLDVVEAYLIHGAVPDTSTACP